MKQALDYSGGFPGASRIKAAGYVGALRYIGFPNRQKCTNREELLDFTANGLGMGLVFESTSNRWRGGFNAGLFDAGLARGHATTIGFPTSRPIYMAVDEDVVTATDFSAMIDYLRGAAGPLGGEDKTGVYGEADVIDRARSAGVASWFWQTRAWSAHRETEAHLLQLIGTVNVGGIGCDLNDVHASDWGQHNAGDIVTPQDKQDIADAVWAKVLDNPTGVDATDYSAGDYLRYANFYAGVLATKAQDAPITDAQVNILAEHLTATLGATLATELGRRLTGQ